MYDPNNKLLQHFTERVEPPQFVVNNTPALKISRYGRDPQGYKSWWLNGKLHREDGPAVIFEDVIVGKWGTMMQWYLNGKWHRVDGPAIERPDGAKFWYLNGLKHRENGPAVEYPEDGHKEWWIHGQRRTDGPALDWHGRREWWVENNPKIPSYGHHGTFVPKRCR